jgi:3-deoxy-D-manno-octulosonic-acid transferase
MSWLANIAYVIAGVIYLPVLLYQMIAQHKNRRGWREKLLGPRASLNAVKSSGTIWVHAVSLGEVNAARAIVDGLAQRFPQRRVVISTTTDTGHARAAALFGEDRVFRYPLDLSWTVRRALRRIDPALIVLVELEVWFNLVTLASRRGVPVCVVNGRLTERSSRRFGWIVPIARRMFASLHWVGAQDAATAVRFERVGVPRERITVTGSVKWDTAAIAERIPGQDELAAAVGIRRDAPLWVCGSTGPGEEAQLLDAYAQLRATHAALQLAIIPRRPERFDEVADLIRNRGYHCIRRTKGVRLTFCEPTERSPETHATMPAKGEGSGRQIEADALPLPDPSDLPGASSKAPHTAPRVILGDTMGELRKFYALADIVFVGRSLIPMGGSDPMEVAALAKPIITGPHMDNFAQPADILAACGAVVQAPDANAVSAQMRTWLTDPTAANQAGQAGRRAVSDNQGATTRTVEQLVSSIAVTCVP